MQSKTEQNIGSTASSDGFIGQLYRFAQYFHFVDSWKITPVAVMKRGQWAMSNVSK
jgi:hypothetical protein